MTNELAVTKLPPRDKQGRLIASDKLPAHGHARAEALSKSGAKTDKLGLVSDGLIASYAPAAGVKREKPAG